MTNPNQILDRNRAHMGPEILSNPGAFLDSKSVLDKFLSANDIFIQSSATRCGGVPYVVLITLLEKHNAMLHNLSFPQAQWHDSGVGATPARDQFSGCRERRSAKGVRPLFFVVGTLFVTFWSLLLMLVSLISSLFA